MLVPPRLFARAKQHLVEAPGVWIHVCSVVPRDRSAAVLDLQKLVPQAFEILNDHTLEVCVSAIGERAPIVRILAGVRQLPAPSPEADRLPLSLVLAVVSFRRHLGLLFAPTDGGPGCSP